MRQLRVAALVALSAVSLIPYAARADEVETGHHPSRRAAGDDSNVCYGDSFALLKGEPGDIRQMLDRYLGDMPEQLAIAVPAANSRLISRV